MISLEDPIRAPPGWSSTAVAINDSGWIVGRHGPDIVLWQGPRAIPGRLRGDGLGQIGDINSHGHISGDAYFYSLGRRSIFLRRRSGYKFIDFPANSSESYSDPFARGLNAAGNIVGSGLVGGSDQLRRVAAFFQPAQPTLLLNDYLESQVEDINRHNWVVGESWRADRPPRFDDPFPVYGNSTRPFVCFVDDDESEQLDAIAGPGMYGAARAINDSGIIVGDSRARNGSRRATFWEIQSDD